MNILKLAVAAGLVLAAAPAFAQESDTIKTIIAKGAVYNIQGTDYAVTYNADGTYINNGAPGGKYKVDGKKLCHILADSGQEVCNDIPDGKKSGDVLDLTSDALGAMKVTIK